MTSNSAWRCCVLVLVVFARAGLSQTGTISFAQPQLLVEEGTGTITSVQIPLVREGGTDGSVVVSITLIDPDSDFSFQSIVTTFNDGVDRISAIAVINNDNTPEGNETFSLTISDLVPTSARIGALRSMQLVILANDQPHGVLQFDLNSLSTDAPEPVNDGGPGITLSVLRGRGRFGAISVGYEVIPSDSSFGTNDISPLRGQISFIEGQASQNFTITVTTDNIPESNELWLVRLIDPTGGALLAQQNIEASINILANDAPLSWSQEIINVDESSGTALLTITRGLLAGGGMAGDLTQPTTVRVTTNGGSAASGIDFALLSETVTFASGSSSLQVRVTIIDDSTAEGDEMFTVLLSSPSSDAVIAPPSIATVIIGINDDAGGLAFFASQGPVVVREDEQTSGRFNVRRSAGTIGDLTVEWRILRSQDNTLATSDFSAVMGNVTIEDGATDAFFDIVALDDDIPEVAESFTVELVRVVSATGGLSDSSPRLASLVVAESDDVYGLLEWAEDGRLAVAGSAPRELRLAINRSGDSIGIVAVDYNIVYVPPSTSMQAGSTDLVFMGSVRLQGGEGLRDFSVTIPDNAFLEVGGNFMATLANATIVAGANFLIPPTTSPRVGSRSQVIVQVPAEATSGFISFAAQSLQVSVAEPLSSISTIDLSVTRSGSFGQATVTWTVTPSVTTQGAQVSDIGANAGLVIIPNGANSGVFSFTVRPDTIPEVDEMFIVTLALVAESNQMILSQPAVVTILANDDPSGIFSISNSTSGPFVLDEDNNRILNITIIRTRGDLTSELIRYDLIGPPGEIAGGQGIVEFRPGDREINITLFVSNDNEPELNETFIFEISSVGPDVQLSPPTAVDVTIAANDDFAGVFSFNTSLLSASIVEPSSNTSGSEDSRAVFTVTRAGGAFGSVDVYWEISNPMPDIAPTSGMLTFAEGQRIASFEVSAQPDDDSEGAETYTVQLQRVNGGARLASSDTTASVTILPNDDPIRFDTSFARAQEGETATFTLIRGGQANGIAEVEYVITHQDTSPADVEVAPAGNIVRFSPGESQARISVSVVDDTEPEQEELLMLTLVSVTSGDAVLVSPVQATLVIESNDDPNGVFRFNESSLMLEVAEGDTPTLMVVRDGGSFGSVDLRWTVYFINASSDVRSPADPTDISPITGLLNFGPGVVTREISLLVEDDSVPELSEVFQVELTIPTIEVEGVTSSGGRLGNDSAALLVVEESDEPNGVLMLAEASTQLTLAEDVPTTNLALGQAEVFVQRNFGTIGSVAVLWEIASSPPLAFPQFVDLLFSGERGADVGVATPRPHTATDALSFSGQPGSLVTVPQQYHPINISSGFTISVWLQPNSRSNGVLLAKTSSSRLIYSLSLIADGDNFLLRLNYQQTANGELASAEISLSQSDLVDGAWHSLVVAIGQGSALFYRDNNFIDSRMLSMEVRDEDGILTVGGQANERYYTGLLQDVRIYLGILTPRHIAILATDPSSSSLTPISGYADFPENVGTASFTISSVDDTIPEPNQLFTLSLTNVRGGARLSGLQTMAEITLLKSDFSNGLFGFASDSFFNVISEPGMVTLFVNRTLGTVDSAVVTWEVREAISGEVATQDFTPTSGRIEFEDGETLQMFTVRSRDETVPELDEDFLVVLVSAVATDNVTSSTPQSGAGVDSSRSQSMLTITENDSPHGILQFSPVRPVAGITIPPATVMPELTVEESDGVATIYVVRAQGGVGNVSVEFFTSDGTATNLGLEPDYTSNAGTLYFASGVTVQSFDVVLLDDTEPELAKTFYVNLTNPQGDPLVPGLNVGQTMAVTIQPSDDAFGRFSFSAASLSRVVAEQVGGAEVNFTVLRDGGRFGMVSVYWEVTRSGSNEQVRDIVPATGEVVFSANQREQQFSLTVVEDMDDELLEVFTVRLVNATVGASISSISTATVSILANDHPYGRFVFTPAFRPLLNVQEFGRVEVVVTREFGTRGQVIVEVQTISSNNTQTNPFLNDVPNLQQLVENSQVATTNEDYTAISETLIFNDGETSKSFFISITQDSEPEIDEYIFAVITRVELNQSSLDAVDTSALPFPAPGNDSLAIVVIAENDDARGIVELSGAAVTTPEPSQSFILIRRSAGTFGNVSVQWQALTNTADPSDISPLGGVIVIPSGITTVPVPVAVLQDNIPEFSEMFTVQLLSVAGGARLGTVRSSVITITASDDPNGAFEFASSSRTVVAEEPEDGELPRTLSLTVQRVRGRVGVVSVTWRVISTTSSDASADIRPVSGTLQFITAATQQSFVLSILPDTIPEVAEVFSVELVSATGGGNIGQFSVANITVPANDGPYGVVSFATSRAVIMEPSGNGTSVATLTVTRSMSFFGDIRVRFNVLRTDVTRLATADGTSLLSYFDTPIANLSLVASALLRQLPDMSTLNACGSACLSDRACLAFSINQAGVCDLYIAIQNTENTMSTEGAQYYQKQEDRVLPFYRSIASDGNDFIASVGQSVIIPSMEREATISVNIVGDTIPELDESLTVTLTGVELVSPDEEEGGPILGAITEAMITILENDDPRGVFSITTSDGSSVARVTEPDSFTSGLTLRVIRDRGHIGQVSVRWTAAGGNAIQGQDFIGTGATLVFEDGETEATIALIILADDIPEVDESLVVSLSGPSDGASITDGDMASATVIIEANDGVAGVVGLSPLTRSAVVGEGSTVRFDLTRTRSTIGRVEVDWQITGANASQEFVTTQGTEVFEEGENTTFIELTVRTDATPELAEQYTLTLFEVRTISDVISPGSGEATLDAQATTATITIRASDNPHGEVDFQDGSLFVDTEEGLVARFTIIRQFGTFGAINVMYRAENGSVNVPNEDTTFATAGMDFNAEELTVTLGDNQQSAVISIPIIDDTFPEVSEVFIVRLTSVTLVGTTDSAILPSLGRDTVAQVTIAPNDNPRGTITFVQEAYTVTEDVGAVNIDIVRERGTFGQVSVVYFITPRQAFNGEDFDVEPLDDVIFMSEQNISTLSIRILDDVTPEIEEDFCVGLRLPRQGALLGNITTTCVTILPNDDAYGVFSFDEDSLTISLQEAQGSTVTGDNVAELRVIRTAGLFGQVTVPYEVSPMFPEGASSSDLVPTRGAVVFNPTDQFRNIQLTAVMDNLPEIAEYFSVLLLDPTELGRLSNNHTVSSVEILPNQDPQGVLQLAPVNLPLMNGGLVVEENVQFVNYEVTRTLGTFGEVTVAVETTAQSAISTNGTSLSAATSQVFNSTSASVWFYFNASSGAQFLMLGSGSQAELYGWRGVFTPVQTLPGTGVVAFASFSPAQGEDIVVVANGGSQGAREVSSAVYRLTSAEQLAMIQTFPTVGATDVVAFSSVSPQEWYVVVANGEDNSGNPNVETTVYRWNGTGLEQHQQLATIGASALEVFNNGGNIALAVSSLTDTRSQLFQWTSGRFRLNHTFSTQQATDIIFLSSGPYLVLTEATGLSVLTQAEDGRFSTNLTLPLETPTRVERVGGGNGSAFVATNRQGPAQMFILEGNRRSPPMEITSVILPTTQHAYPFLTSDGNTFLAAAGVVLNTQEVSILYELNLINPNSNDFFSKNLTLTFRPTESRLFFSIAIFDDDLPEIDETFSVGIRMPTGGARLGEQTSAAMTILTNDDAHGLISFNENSRSFIISELAVDNFVFLEVVRDAGRFGSVRVAWSLSGGHTTGEITPSSGQVFFPEGDAMTSIFLTITPDDVSELNEVTTVTLNNVIENGVPSSGDQSRGARVVPGENEAVITVLANDDPHGVVTWSPVVVMTQEQEGGNSAVQLTILREFGAIGAIVISYTTETASSLPPDQRAQSLQDFVPASGDVVMGDGQTSATITLTILADNIPEPNETFLVNMTGVRIANEADRQGSSTNSPRVSLTGQTALVEIAENDNNRGLLNFTMAAVSVVETFDSEVTVQVSRTRGTFGMVSVQYAAVEGNATSADYSLPPDNLLVFESGVDVMSITIGITNDVIPEVDETFQLMLRSPQGGAEIGSPPAITITILSNDDVNGIFSFADSSFVVALSESGGATSNQALLRVQREVGFVGEVTVFWEVAEEGIDDLEPTRGNITFQENVMQQEFAVRAVQDGLPEIFEVFPVRLVSIVGGGRIVDPRESLLAIQASDDPAGVLGLQQFPGGLVVNEGEVLVVGVIRSAGTLGTVTLTWDITPPDTSVFATTRDTVVLVDGQEQATIRIQTLSDQIPEVRRSYSLRVESLTVARLDVNASSVEVIVPASNNPHGSVQFASSSPITTSEGARPLQINLVRSNGLIGALRVNYTVSLDSANEMDFSITQSSVIIPSEASAGVLEVAITDDALPELAETFTITLTSVEVVNSTDPVTTPPSLGSNTQVAITIEASDEPSGTVTLAQDTYNVNEGDTVAITLLRTGGTLGVVTVSYATVNGRATAPDDYTDSSGTVVFSAEQTSAQILVPTINDALGEVVEDFGFNLQSVSGGLLGNITRATIFIAASDSPFGVIGFNPNLVTGGVSVPNPTQTPIQVFLTITRMGGTIGSTDISWNVTGPGATGIPSSDIAASSISGTVTLVDGQSSGPIIITVLPTSIDEQEETFTVLLTSTTGSVLLDPTRSRVLITVMQNGAPSGVVSFLGDAITTQRVNEDSTLTLPLERSGSFSATVDVTYTVSRVTGGGDAASQDVSPAGGTVSFPALQGRASIDLMILSDEVPEADETFTVTLNTASGGATINPQANVATFIINANGNLFGEYGIVNASLTASSEGGTTARTLAYTLVRIGGDSIGSNIILQHSYSQDPSTDIIPAMITRSLPPLSSQLRVTIPIPGGSFLYPGATIRIAIGNVTVSSPAEMAGMSGTISTEDGAVQVTVADAVANIIVGFTEQSLIASVNEGGSASNVELTVFRRGELGNVEVGWTTVTTPTAPGFTPGSILPVIGTLQFPSLQNNTTLTLTATPVQPHGRPEMFQVGLTVLSLDQNFPSQIASDSGIARIEPMGVFLIPNTSYSAVEGTTVSIPVWRRFGSSGAVVVTGVASAVSASSLPPQVLPAIPNTDFSSASMSVRMEDGQTTATFNITLIDNTVESSFKQFQFSLRSVTGVSSPATPQSPRLSAANTTTSITIIDDEGGAGVFQLDPTTISVAEGSTFNFRVLRTGGTTGSISVMLQTMEEIGQATSGLDFQPFNQILTFDDGVSQMLQSVVVLDDTIPEGPEDFLVSLSVPSGETLVNNDASTLRVQIQASDNLAGVFSFITASLRLSEDGPSSGELEVRRTVGLTGVVTLQWQALYTDGLVHAVPLTDILVSTSGTITFPDNSATSNANIQLQLITNAVPAGGEQFTVRLTSLTPGTGLGVPAEATVTVQPRVASIFRIATSNLTSVVTDAGIVSIVIERTDGIQTEARVNYNTSQPRQEVAVGRLRFQPALPHVHFTVIESSSLTFAPGQVSMSVPINVIAVESQPVAFLVQIGSTAPHQTMNGTAVVVLATPGPTTSLYSIYFEALAASSPQDLDRISSNLLGILGGGMVSGQNGTQSNLTRFIIDELITKTMAPTNIDYSNTNYIPNMLDIFQTLLVDPSFAGRSLFVVSMKSFAYSLIEDTLCNGPAINYSRPMYFIQAAKLSPASLSGRRFSSNNNADYVQYPTEVIGTQEPCFNVHYIEFFTDNLYQSTLRSKVLSTGIEDVTLSTSEPVVYRIHADHNLGLLPDQDDCLLWAYPSTSGTGEVSGSQWDSSVCSPQKHFVLQENYIQCGCRQLGDMAAATDVPIGYGWTFPAGISAAIVIIAMLMVMILHLRYLSRTQLATRILICLCFSVFLFQLILLVDIFASDSEDLPADGCSALGALLQFTAVAQFLWIAAMAVALWAHFVGFTSGTEPLVIYIVICWGAAVVVVVATILIGRFAVNLPLTSSEGLYGDINDLCFMPSLPASLIATALPALLSLLAMVALISYTCIYWSRWEDIKSFYYDSFNRTEIPLLLVFFGLTFLSSVAAYLHAYIALSYTFGAFVILNTLEGLYAAAVYFLVSWHTLTRKHDKYHVGDEVEALEIPGDDEDPFYGSLSASTLGSSKEKLVEKDLLDQSPGHSSGVVSIGMRRLESGSATPVETKDDSQMDDLLFMLKTQNFSPGSVGSDDSGEPSMHRPHHSRTEQFQRRRISIADTHL